MVTEVITHLFHNSIVTQHIVMLIQLPWHTDGRVKEIKGKKQWLYYAVEEFWHGLALFVLFEGNITSSQYRFLLTDRICDEAFLF